MPSQFETTFNARVVPAAQRAFGVEVYLARGPLKTAAITARRSNRQYEAIGQEYGVEWDITMRDFILPKAITLDGDTIEPKAGDRIKEGEEIFEIKPPDNNTPAVEYHSATGEWLVHTQRIES